MGTADLLRLRGDKVMLTPAYERVRLPGKSARTRRVMRNRALLQQWHGPQQRYRVSDVHVMYDPLSGDTIERRVPRRGTVARIA